MLLVSEKWTQGSGYSLGPQPDLGRGPGAGLTAWLCPTLVCLGLGPHCAMCL